MEKENTFKPTSFRIPPELKKRLKIAAAERDTEGTAVVIAGIKAWLDPHPLRELADQIIASQEDDIIGDARRSLDLLLKRALAKKNRPKVQPGEVVLRKPRLKAQRATGTHGRQRPDVEE